MSIQADLIVYDPLDHPKTIIEIKSKRKTSDGWASQLLRNLLAHGFLIEPEFFVVITIDRIYLWKNNNHSNPTNSIPTCSVDTKSIWQQYTSKDELSGPFIDGKSFELIVFNWLRDINSTRTGELSANLPTVLMEALRGKILLSEVRPG